MNNLINIKLDDKIILTVIVKRFIIYWEDTERYRSGHNGLAWRAIGRPKAVSRVRIPPSPPYI